MLTTESLKLVFCILLIFRLCYSKTPLSLASYYGDNMVLQKAPKSSQIWGYADVVGSTVTVTLGTQVQVHTKVYMDSTIGKNVWKVMLPPQKGHGPVNISVENGNERVTITNVLFGDVWLCSGEGNMQFTLSMAFNESEEIANAVNFPNIRLFSAAHEWSNKTEYELLGVDLYWSMPNRDSVGHSDWTYFSAVCWLYGKYLYKQLQYPIGLIATDWNATSIEAWSSPDAIYACQPSFDIITTHVHLPQNSPSYLWNAMVHPFLNLTLYGAIWYQGESDIYSPPDIYKCKFPAMIDDWRKKFNEGSAGQTDILFPFGFVQLAPWRDNSTIIEGFPDIRWDQTCGFGYAPNAQMPQTFMATTIDLPDFSSPYSSIFPRDKQDVASRLVLSALQVAYNIKTMGRFSGPMISAYSSDLVTNRLTLSFDNGTDPIRVKSKNNFEICCSVNNQSKCDGTDDSKWVAAPIVAFDNTSVTLATCDGMWIMGVRYAWRESPCPTSKMCAVYSVENDIPMSPYIAIGLIN